MPTGDVVEKYAKGKRGNKNRSKSKDSKGSRSQSKKKKKTKEKIEDEIEDNSYSDEVLKKMVKNSKIKKVNVQELKDICKSRNIATKGLKKADIIEKIINYLDEQ